MDASTIDKLASMDPSSGMPRISMADLNASNPEWSPFHDRQADHYLSKYKRPNFGYYIALQFANHRIKFPVSLLGRDSWVNRAYAMIIDPWNCYDEYIAEAYHIAMQARTMPEISDQLQCLLLSYDPIKPPDEHIRDVSARTGIKYDVVEAYEILFYNVLDRSADASYLSKEVYPSSRVVEFDENYLRNSAHADILKRAAFNHKDMDLTAYLAGLGDHKFMRKMAASSDREADLTKFIMGNGLLLTHTNLLNQKSVGMGRAATLLAASRQGGQQVEEPPLGGVFPLFNAAYKNAVRVNQGEVIEQIRSDAGQVLDV